MLYPLKFQPILKSLIWGGERIIPYKGIESDQSMVGESWELSGIHGSESVVANGELVDKSITEILKTQGADLIGKDNYKRFGNEFPLLIKFIDAKADLSIQVHPNDELAEIRHHSKGKTEMWYVVDADHGAKLRSGFSKQVTAIDFLNKSNNGTVTDVLKEYEVSKGDIFFLPAGRVHSIGAGCFIAEIQQTSNITYRLFDFNRTDANGNPRELHTELAVDAIDYVPLNDYRTEYDHYAKDQDVKVVSCPYFTTSILNLTESHSIDYGKMDSFVIYICTEGKAMINGTPLNCGETLLLPAITKQVNIETNGCNLLSTYIS